MSIGNHDHRDGNEVNQLQFAVNESRWEFPWYGHHSEFDDGVSTVLMIAMDSEVGLWRL